MNQDVILFAGTKYRQFDEIRLPGYAAPDYRIPSLVSDGVHVVAGIDSASGGMDWGKIGISVKVSSDSGKSWSEEIRVMSPPCCKATVGDQDTTSAIVMDPLMCAAGEKIVLMFDMFPESKGLHDRSRLDRTDGYCTIGGRQYRMLFTAQQSLSGLKKGGTATGYNCYTLREDHFVYDPDGNKTKYYLPKRHAFSCAFETMGDLYYGDGEFLEKEPPLYPEHTNDIYVGNIFLNTDQPPLTETPVRVVKNRYRGEYECPETKAAPFRAPVTCYLWQTESTDGGYTWSQPVDITAQVKRPRRDRKFFGTGPGAGLCLTHQKQGNGRLLMPVYALGKAAVIFSDDGGAHWQRHHSLYSRNVDETQLLELHDGRVLCLGRQKKIGKTPLSVSTDGGKSYRKAGKCDVISVKCQKSMLMLPKDGENGFCYAEDMDRDKAYFVCAHPTGHGGTDSSRSDGVLSLCEVNGTHIRTVRDIPLKKKEDHAEWEKHADFFAYSSVCLLPDNTIGVLYETCPSGCLAFARVVL